MPTERYGKVRRMLHNGMAVAVKREPFTIRLLYETDNITQPVTLGVDAGTAHVGLSATTEDRELFCAEVTLRTDIVKLLAQRREVRRTRRSRKTRYRAPRFDNRRRREGWLAPSVEQRIQSHLHLIEKVSAILPISKTVIEVAQFDTQLIKNPDMQGEQYQQGEQLGFWNTREYVLFRDNHECQCCHGRSKDPVLNVHHIESRQTGGNSPDNLVTLCETCHKAYHKGEVDLKLKRSSKSLRDAAVMSIMRWELYDMGYHRIGCILCPMSNYKQKMRECKDFPYVKAKWIDAIKRIRKGGGITKQTYSVSTTYKGGGEPTSTGTVRNGLLQGRGLLERERERERERENLEGGADVREKTKESGETVDCPTVGTIPNEELENQIAENIFDWWISSKSYARWYEEKFLQQKFNFDEIENEADID